jgi:hypothetical protein
MMRSPLDDAKSLNDREVLELLQLSPGNEPS